MTYYDKVQAVLRRYDVLFVADEAICGFGRLGDMFGCQTYGIQPALRGARRDPARVGRHADGGTPVVISAEDIGEINRVVALALDETLDHVRREGLV